jgi:flagellar protein FlaF
MAFASIIASAIGILLLIITAYVLVGGVLTTTQIAMNAQSDMTAVHMQMLGTSFDINSVENSSSDIKLTLVNSGSEQIDLNDINVFLQKSPPATVLAPILIPKGSGSGYWSVDPGTKILWRPTEELNMSVGYESTYPVVIQITTGNGFSRITEVEPP